MVGLAILFPVIYLYLRRKFKKDKTKNASKELVLGLFHPYCNAGGGGEKVLWIALQAIQEKWVDRFFCRLFYHHDIFRYPKVKINVYTGDVEVTPVEILEKVRKNMNVNLKNISFIYLNKRKWIEGNRYPVFTLLGQALGSMYLAYEALNKLVPGKWQ